jgi:hypothetical protein
VAILCHIFLNFNPVHNQTYGIFQNENIAQNAENPLNLFQLDNDLQ